MQFKEYAHRQMGELSDEEIKHNDIQHDEMWFDILDCLYKFHSQTKESELQQEHNDINEVVSQTLEILLKKMCLFVSPQKILETIISKYTSSEFKEFKELIITMLSSVNRFISVLVKAKHLLFNSQNFVETN